MMAGTQVSFTQVGRDGAGWALDRMRLQRDILLIEGPESLTDESRAFSVFQKLYPESAPNPSGVAGLDVEAMGLGAVVEAYGAFDDLDFGIEIYAAQSVLEVMAAFTRSIITNKKKS